MLTKQVRRSAVALATLLLLPLLACTTDDANPLSARERALAGTWRLDLQGVAAEDLALVCELGEDHRVSHRLGGAFLRTLRDLAELEGVDLGQLRSLEAIDGARVAWRGTWSLAGDSLRLAFTQFQVEALGQLPLLGQVAVPVYLRNLSAAERVDMAYTYQVTEQQLVLRGAAASAGLAGDAAAAQTTNLDPLGRAVLDLAGQVLADTYRPSSANEFVYLRD